MDAAMNRAMRAVAPLAPFTAAALAAALLFAAFLAAQGFEAPEALGLVVEGAFGSAFAWQNTLARAAPLMLTALCVALPARAGLVIIGGEGALALGALAAAMVPSLTAGWPALPVQLLMALAGFVAGGAWIAASAWLRHVRGINETISSLLLSYIGIALFNFLVEGVLRDPASLNKPSTPPLPDAVLIGPLPGLEVHWGLVWGVLACAAAWFLLRRTVFGFSVGVVGGNPRAALMAGLPVGALLIAACFLGGGAAGVAGMLEVAAVHGSANASLLAGYGYAGILVSFAARHNPLGIVAGAILVGGIGASGSLLQRRLDLPDAAVLVLQGALFVALLAFETLNRKGARRV
ncbi:MAG: ABC transporter permease [Proteobacteria bacterium]|nr:ABC transporter permease [Pseudomonadota bacterium]